MMKKISVTIKTLAPIVVSARGNDTVLTETRSDIPGNILRGAIAAEYIWQNNLGKKAHEDATFRELFLDKLRFVTANPVGENGERSFVIPASLQRGKKGSPEGDKVYDLLSAESPVGAKSFRGYGVIEDKFISTVSVKKSISLHMSRSGKDERLQGSSNDGNIYNYEAIESGESFQGEIIGEEDSLKKLLAVFPTKKIAAHIGRSKYTQYGTAEMNFGEIEEIAKPAINGDTLKLRFDTPYISGITGSSSEQLQLLLAELGAGFEIEKIFASKDEVENFVGIWGMKSARENALAAGTIFELKKTGGFSDSDLAKLGEIMYGGVGLRTEEGFGQLRIWAQNGLELKDAREKAAAEINSQDIPDMTKAIVKSVIARRINENLLALAAEEAKELMGSSGKTQFFSRLLGMLDDARAKGQIKDSFNLMIKETSGTAFKNYMRNIILNGASLGDLIAADTMSYEKNERMTSLMADVGELLTDIGAKKQDFSLSDGTYFYTYWHTFFRVARKAAVKKEAE